MTLVVAVVALVVAIASYLTWTAGRLDRLTARVDAAWSALDAHLVRRAAAVTDLAAHVRRHRLLDEDAARSLAAAAASARAADRADREQRENDLSRAIATALADLAGKGGKTEGLVGEVNEAGGRVMLARQFYNDAVRDNRHRRRRWVPRLLTLRHRRETQPPYFEIAEPA